MKNLILISLVIIFITACSSPNRLEDNSLPNYPYNWVNSVHTTLGVPVDRDTSDDYIIVRPQYVLSYNHNRNVCNWVAWEVNSSWFGSTPRYSGYFLTDSTLPAQFYHVNHFDYSGSGYDRGHMCMSDERTASVADNLATFVLSNILAQKPDLNQGVWLDFEEYCNSRAQYDNKELFVFAGGVFHSNNTIKNRVAIPDSTWKIAVVLDYGQELNDVTSETEVYSVMMPNIDGIRTDSWEKYKTTIRQIEKSTGYYFLYNVPAAVRNVLEDK